MRYALLKVNIVVVLVVCLFFNVFNVSAVKYVENIVNDYEIASDCKFLPPGDLDANGIVNALDNVKMRKILLEKSYDKKYSDVNGDNFTNLKDLVRQKKNACSNFDFLSNNVINLNGCSSYTGEFISLLGEGASYKISYKYKSETPIKVVINGLGNEIIYESQISSELKEVSYTLKTPFTITGTSDVELKIIGVGVIDDFTIIRANMDNILIEDW